MDPGDSENSIFIPKYLHPNFGTKSTGLLGCYGVKLGCKYFWIKVTFLESPGSLHYCNVFGFLVTWHALPCRLLKGTVAPSLPHLNFFSGGKKPQDIRILRTDGRGRTLRPLAMIVSSDSS